MIRRTSKIWIILGTNHARLLLCPKAEFFLPGMRYFRRQVPAGSEIDAAALALPIPVAGRLQTLGAANLPGCGSSIRRRRRLLVFAGHRCHGCHRCHRCHGCHGCHGCPRKRRLGGRRVGDFGHFIPIRRRYAPERRPIPGLVVGTVAEIPVPINPRGRGGVLKSPAEAPFNDKRSCSVFGTQPKV